VATGNPGCLAHMANGIRRERMPVRLAHPITLLAEAYRAETFSTVGRDSVEP